MAFSEQSEQLVNDLIQAEYKNACEQAKKEFNDNYVDRYHSFYEGYAILKEEVEEAKEQVENLELDFNDIWRAIKNNASLTVKNECLRMQDSVIMTIKELAQACAVLTKILNTLEKNEVEE